VHFGNYFNYAGRSAKMLSPAVGDRTALLGPTIKNYFRTLAPTISSRQSRFVRTRHNGKGCGLHVTGRTRAV